MPRNKNKIRNIAIYGASGFGLEIAMLIEQINAVSKKWNTIGFFDDNKPQGNVINDLKVLGGISDLNNWKTELNVVFGIGIPKIKNSVFSKINNHKILYPKIIHPSVILGNNKFLQIGEGTVICAGTIITTNIEIGKYVLLNLSCTVGHETKIGDFTSFMPTCNISGEVEIGKGNFWGTGSKIINGKSVGNNVIVGSGAVIINDIPDNVTVVGIPAKIIKENPNITF